MIKIFTVIFLLIATHGRAQLFDHLTRQPPYLAVFAATDAFDSSYLTILETSIQQQLPDTAKMAIGNDLAYYWHTLNLTDSSSAKAVMQSSQNSVLSMAITHQKLYQKENQAAIEMKDYFLNLSESIPDSFNATDRIRIHYNTQPIELDVDTAVAVGLIANELLTHALKYAFPLNQAGEMAISLEPTGTVDESIFRINDNGIGKPENAIAKGTGFGTGLVNLLVQQRDGKLTVDSDTGTHISIKFKHIKLHQ